MLPRCGPELSAQIRPVQPIEGTDRLALVIGNDAYAVSPLATCVRDGNAVAEWLKSVGYAQEAIQLLTDAGQPEMRKGLAELVDRCRSFDE